VGIGSDPSFLRPPRRIPIPIAPRRPDTIFPEALRSEPGNSCWPTYAEWLRSWPRWAVDRWGLRAEVWRVAGPGLVLRLGDFIDGPADTRYIL
jgi:hypothetical protein